ncbi:MAG: hypothetical protein Q4G50_13485 [Corynebacterium sp.]|uniref:hypothetical protein n=1 Tax=Corynebacterium sp. TaxID=1720 RepID=UPI0026E03FF5|nr:hypothetical protein [Corynebacterium sp.]MDO5670997.1 hypothetical protein [Corynebacterium sp.]
MTKFIRIAVAAATAATVALAPMSTAHASSFGSSSNGGQGTVVETGPSQPKSEDQEFNDRFRELLRSEIKKSGFPENPVAGSEAERVLGRALNGELVYQQSEDGFSAAEDSTFVEGGYYYSLVFRISKDLAATADFSQATDMGSQPLAFPFGIASDFDEDYHYFVVTLKVL